MNVSANGTITRNIGVTVLHDPWFQVFSGAVYANGSVTSSIPATAANKFLIASDANHAPEVVSGQNIVTGEGSISAKNWQFDQYSQTDLASLRFNNLLNSFLPLADDTDFNGSPPRPSDATDGVAIYYRKTDQLRLNGNWQNIDFPVIIIVDGISSTTGDVIIPNTLPNNKITLGPNGFLMIVAKQDILVGSDIGEDNNGSVAADLEGIFFAGRNMDVGGSNDRLVDKRINIYGTVLTGIESPGSYLSKRTHEENGVYPADYFVFNPKLIINVPEVISQPIYAWNESSR